MEMSVLPSLKEQIPDTTNSLAVSGLPAVDWVPPAPFSGHSASVQKLAPPSLSRVFDPSNVSHFC